MTFRFTSCNAPAIVIADLGPKMDRLEYMVSNIELSRINQISLEIGHSKLPDFVNQGDRLKKSAEAILSSAGSVLETQSNWFGSRRGDTTGSELGKPLSDENFSKIESWIPEPAVEEETLEDMESSEYRSASRSSKIRSSFSPPTTVESAGKMEHERNLEQVSANNVDSEDTFEYELVQQFLIQGQEKYGLGNFRDSEMIFRRGLQHAEKLSNTQRDRLELKNIQYKIGICYFKQNRLGESQEMLLPLTEGALTGPRDITIRLEASHTLAEVFLARRQFEDARAYCEKSMNGRRQHEGKEHPEYFKSMILLGSIYKSQGDLVTAAVIAELLPLEFADARKGLAQNIPSTNKSDVDVVGRAAVVSGKSIFRTPSKNQRFAEHLTRFFGALKQSASKYAVT